MSSEIDTEEGAADDLSKVDTAADDAFDEEVVEAALGEAVTAEQDADLVLKLKALGCGDDPSSTASEDSDTPSKTHLWGTGETRGKAPREKARA